MFIFTKDRFPLNSRKKAYENQISLKGTGNFFYRKSAFASHALNAQSFLFHRGFPRMEADVLADLLQKLSEGQNPSEVLRTQGSYLFLLVSLGSGDISIFRDAWGSTPLFYSKDGKIISDLISEVTDNLPKAPLNSTAVAEYLACSYVVGHRTLYENIDALTPRNSLRIHGATVQQVSEHHYPQHTQTISQDDLVPILEKAIDNSVRWVTEAAKNSEKGFISLSGGTDSTLLSVKFSETLRAERFVAGTVDYENWQRNDTPYFSLVADRLKLQKKIETINNAVFSRALENQIAKTAYIYHTFAPSFFSLNASIKAEHENVSFQVNGTGPDEAVIGFEQYSLQEMQAFDALPKSSWVDFLITRIDSFYTPYWTVERIMSASAYSDPAQERRKLAQELLPGAEKFSEFQRRYSKETTTDHHIRMLYDISDAQEIDMIFPYCTQELFEVCFQYSYYSINDHQSYKHVFKKILLKYFETEFVYRPKIGFHAPIDRTFKDDNSLGGLLAKKNLQRYDGYLRPEPLREELEYRLHHKKAPLDYLMWTVLNLLLFIDRKNSVNS